MPTITRNFRLDQQLVNDLIELAKKDGRSLNSFVAFRLQEIVASELTEGSKPPISTKSTKLKKGVIPHISDNVVLHDATASNKTIKPITDPKPATNYTVDTRPKMPSGLTLMQQIEWREKNGG